VGVHLPFVHEPKVYGVENGAETYQSVVHELARQGWRLVQVLVEQPAAMVSEYVLIFERPTDRTGEGV